MKIWTFFHILLLFICLNWTTQTQVKAGTARYGEHNNRLLDNYELSPRTCSLNGRIGKCRFVWDCYKAGGTNLGLCRLDTSMFGSCCSAPENSWTQFPTTIIADPDSNVVETTPPLISSPESPIIDYIEEQFIVLPEINLKNLSKTTTTSTTTSSTMKSTTRTTTVSAAMSSSEDEALATTTMQPASRETEENKDENYMYRPSQCGIVHRMSPKEIRDRFDAGDGQFKKKLRIIGGQDATFAAWPWVASVRRSSLFGYSSTHSCGGVLLNENWVATAAHCVAALSKSLIRVRLGEFNFKDDNEEFPFVERRIEKKVVHPNYNFTSYENDLALVKLTTPVEFSTHISPLCLPRNLNDSLVGQNASIVGWGRLSEGGKYSQLLQFVQVPIISNEECVKMFKSAGRMEMIPENFMCAGYKEGGRDGCQGDSGGPLQVRGPEDRWFLAGVMSWGIGCGEPNSPGVYTRISKFTEWILQNASV